MQRCESKQLVGRERKRRAIICFEHKSGNHLEKGGRPEGQKEGVRRDGRGERDEFHLWGNKKGNFDSKM